jgi:hypothetical protein
MLIAGFFSMLWSIKADITRFKPIIDRIVAQYLSDRRQMVQFIEKQTAVISFYLGNGKTAYIYC